MSEIENNDPYDILGITPIATDEEIKVAYRKKAMESHPDKHPEDPEHWKTIFQKVQSAYACLKDPQERHIYDISGEWEGNPKNHDEFDEFDFNINIPGFPPGFQNVIFMTQTTPQNIDFSALSGLFGNILQENLGGKAANLLNQFLDPLKSQAQEAIHRIKEENENLQKEIHTRQNLQKQRESPQCPEISALLSELWNIPAAKPRKKKTKIGEKRDIVPLVIGECLIGDDLVKVFPVMGREGCWSWRWKGGPGSYDGFLEALVYSHEVITEGIQSWEEYNIQTWISQDQTIMFALWKKVNSDSDKSETPAHNLPKYLKKQMIEHDEGGMILVRSLVRMGNEPTDWVIGANWQPNAYDKGRGWLFQDSGIWIVNETQKPYRGNLWIHAPVIDIGKWNVKQEIAKEWVFSPYVLENE